MWPGGCSPLLSPPDATLPCPGGVPFQPPEKEILLADKVGLVGWPPPQASDDQWGRKGRASRRLDGGGFCLISSPSCYPLFPQKALALPRLSPEGRGAGGL